MSENINTILNSALDNGDWPTAALCILAKPVSARWTENLTGPLAQIALGVDLGEQVPHVGEFVRGMVRLSEAMEAGHANQT